MATASGTDLPAHVEEETRCFIWDGPTSSGGYPVHYHAGEQLLVHRELWEDAYQVELPKGVSLLRVCPNPCCVLPSHYVVKSPRNLCRRLGSPLDELRAVTSLLKAWKVQSRLHATTSWDTSDLPSLGLDNSDLTSLATSLRTHRQLVLAAYGELVRKDIPRRGPSSESPVAQHTAGV